MITMDLRADLRQQQTISPRLQQAVRLLQLSSTDFAQALSHALGRNPFLELDDDGDEDEAIGLASHADDVERELWIGDGRSGSSSGAGADESVLAGLAVPRSLTQHLADQLRSLPVAERERALARVIIDSIDDDGYLRTPLDELLPLAALDPMPRLPEMERALQRVQSLDPAGVAARSVAECLRLQLPAIDCPRLRALARSIVEDHVDLLAARDVPALARKLRCPAPLVEAACGRIRHLDPHPGWRHGAGDIHYVVPDVIARRGRGAWTVQLNPSVVPRVRLNHVYAEMFQRSRGERPESHGELAVHLQEARWTVRNVEQRFSTILEVSRSIVRRQRQFFEFGPMAMKPLGLREIAEELGMHESTVSRVTNNKFIATPQGVFELKKFFSRALVSASGRACSGTAIRGLVQAMLEDEAGDDPLSDAEIARRLSRQGLTVARRTVTKYRQSLRIEPVDRRRRLPAKVR